MFLRPKKHIKYSVFGANRQLFKKLEVISSSLKFAVTSDFFGRENHCTPNKHKHCPPPVGTYSTYCDCTLSFPVQGALFFQKDFTKEPSGPPGDGMWAPCTILRLSARQGRNTLLPGRDKGKTNIMCWNKTLTMVPVDENSYTVNQAWLIKTHHHWDQNRTQNLSYG